MTYTLIILPIKTNIDNCEDVFDDVNFNLMYQSAMQRWVVFPCSNTIMKRQNKLYDNGNYIKRSTHLPSSCGSSWQNIAILVDIPRGIDAEKAAPMARPSIKLWIPSPNTIITAMVGIPGGGNTCSL